jgi:hypothetical protein
VPGFPIAQAPLIDPVPDGAKLKLCAFRNTFSAIKLFPAYPGVAVTRHKVATPDHRGQRILK